jgi:hypothetical protein
MSSGNGEKLELTTPYQMLIIRRRKRAMTMMEGIQAGRAAQSRSGLALPEFQAELGEAGLHLVSQSERFCCFQRAQLKRFASGRPLGA